MDKDNFIKAIKYQADCLQMVQDAIWGRKVTYEPDGIRTELKDNAFNGTEEEYYKAENHSRWTCKCIDCRNDYHDWVTSANQGLE